MSNAPVCHVIPQSQPGKPSLPPMPPIPPATDLQSALYAINQLRNLINILLNQINQNNISTGGSSTGGSGAPGTPSTNTPFTFPVSQFTEIAAKRITKTVRIFGTREDGTQDKTVWVDVKQIVGLTFEDQITDQTWVWKQ